MVGRAQRCDDDGANARSGNKVLGANPFLSTRATPSVASILLWFRFNNKTRTFRFPHAVARGSPRHVGDGPMCYGGGHDDGDARAMMEWDSR